LLVNVDLCSGLKADEQSGLENERNSDYNKRTGAPKSTQVEAASTPPEDFDPDDDEYFKQYEKFKKSDGSYKCEKNNRKPNQCCHICD
jgi:hypothetical protein